MTVQPLQPGDIILSWCSHHNTAATPPGKATEHRYQPGEVVKLVCLECEKEKESK